MQKRAKLRRWIFWPFVIFMGLALSVSYCSVFINPARLWLPAFFGLYFVPLVIINIFFFIILLIRRSSIAWFPFTALLPTLLFIELFIRWGTVDEVVSEVSVKVASYNVCNFQGYGKKTRDETLVEISQFLDREKIDIVCMQEFFCPDTSILRRLFPSFPYHCFGEQAKGKSYRGNLILSRHPVQYVGVIPFHNSRRNCIYADFHLHGTSFRVYTTHFESNNISLNAIADRMRNYQEAPDELLKVHIRIRDAFRIRAQQVETLSQHLKNIDTPFILCGDFNDTPVSYTYHRLQEGINDSFRHAGNGLGATFRYLWPGLRIDYILFSNAFSAKSHVTTRVPFSDHYPVITELIVL